MGKGSEKDKDKVPGEATKDPKQHSLPIYQVEPSDKQSEIMKLKEIIKLNKEMTGLFDDQTMENIFKNMVKNYIGVWKKLKLTS